MKTQKAIKHVLRERWYAWEEAREVFDAHRHEILSNINADAQTQGKLSDDDFVEKEKQEKVSS